MAEDGKFRIEKFDGIDFSWWKMQIEDLLVQKDLDVVLGDKPEKMSDADWASLDRKAMSVIRLSLTKNVAFNILKEKTVKGIMDALSNMYEKPYAANKVFLIRELVNTRMREGTLVTEHINKLNSILARLASVGIKFDDEVQALLLLSSLPDSWSGTVTAVTGSVGPDGFTFDQIRDLVAKSSGLDSGSYAALYQRQEGIFKSKKDSIKTWRAKFVFVFLGSGSPFGETAHSSFRRRTQPFTTLQMVADVEKLCEIMLSATARMKLLREESKAKRIGEGQSTTRPLLFDGYTYWKERMRICIQSTNFLLCRIIKKGEEVPMKKVGETTVPKIEDEYDAQDIKKIENNAKAINIIYCAVNPDDYQKISCCSTAKEMWDKLEITYEGEQKKKGIALKASTSQEPAVEDSSDKDNEFGLVIKKFHKFMRKEYERKGKKQGGPPKCYGCGEIWHIKPKCPNAKNEKEKKSFKKHRAYISWGGDSGDESSDGEENESANLCHGTRGTTGRGMYHFF
ncbi:unnamed protein product [Cuscuta campestris]|uniref:CCHC-type domain-containing protein n=1 Tax=Cuscuta campestris TaxID=132261 RepID=A0A484KV74_9ASTE|nr:unnamed protein product [Cuscuta campestris]